MCNLSKILEVKLHQQKEGLCMTAEAGCLQARCPSWYKPTMSKLWSSSWYPVSAPLLQVNSVSIPQAKQAHKINYCVKQYIHTCIFCVTSTHYSSNMGTGGPDSPKDTLIDSFIDCYSNLHMECRSWVLKPDWHHKSAEFLRFNSHYPREPGLTGVYWSKGWCRLWWQLDYWNHKSCKAPVKSSPPTNQHPVFFTGRMPFLSPNQQCQSTEGKYHIPWTCYPKLTWGLPTLSLTTNSSWLPWERVAMPVISPLMPVPHVKAQNETCIQDERPSTGQASAAVQAGCRVAWSKCLLGCGSCTDRWVLATTRSLALHSPSLVIPSHCT